MDQPPPPDKTTDKEKPKGTKITKEATKPTTDRSQFKYIVLTPKPSFVDTNVEILPPKQNVAKPPATIPPEIPFSTEQAPQTPSSSQQAPVTLTSIQQTQKPPSDTSKTPQTPSIEKTSETISIQKTSQRTSILKTSQRTSIEKTSQTTSIQKTPQTLSSTQQAPKRPSIQQTPQTPSSTQSQQTPSSTQQAPKLASRPWAERQRSKQEIVGIINPTKMNLPSSSATITEKEQAPKFHKRTSDRSTFKYIVLTPKPSFQDINVTPKPRPWTDPPSSEVAKKADPAEVAKKTDPPFQTVILSPKTSLTKVRRKRVHTYSYKTVILSPKSSHTIRTKRGSKEEEDYVHKELNKLESKYVTKKRKSKTIPVILSPKESVVVVVPKPRELTIISSGNLPPLKEEKVEPVPVVLEEKVILTQEERPIELINELTSVQRSELDMAEKILAMIAEGNPKEKFLNQLKAFGIPDQKKLLRYLLEGDLHSFDFGGLMRKYYSYVLRSYTLVNMQDNYREPYTFSTCFASLDVSKIGSKAEEQEKEMSKKLKQREEKQEDLRLIAVDEDHFIYLKQLADEQPTTIPLTVLKGLVQQSMPVLVDTYRTYARSLGNRHPCTKIACEQYLRMSIRLHLYNTMEKSRDVNSQSNEKLKKMSFK